MHLAWAPLLFMVVRDGDVSSKGVFGEALKSIPGGRETQPGGMDWK